MPEGGLDIEELAKLACRYGLGASVQEISFTRLWRLLDLSHIPIVYLNRFPMDRVFAIHAVIPVRITRRFVTVLDPLRGERKVSCRRFETARRFLSRLGVV